MKPAISVRNLSKCYKLGVINRKTLVDEVHYLWSKVRGRDPREHFTKVGHSTTETRRINAEKAGKDRFWALKDISFDVQPGEVLGIIGKNGAGKSTLLKILTRITEPTSGEAIINGRVGSLLEVGTGFHPELTGRENVYMNGTILGMKKREIDAKFDEIVAFSELEKFIDTPVKRYSSGMYVRLAFAVAAHLEPEILLIDEVLAVGDAGFQKKCLGKMNEVSKEGRTILFVSHNLPMVSKLCNRSVVIRGGEVLINGETEEILQRYIADSSYEATTYDLSKIQDRRGAGRVLFNKIEFLDKFYQKRKIVSTGDTVVIRVYFDNVTCEKYSAARFSVLIKTFIQDLILLDTSVALNQEIVIKRSGFVDFYIEKLPLTRGKYGTTLFVEAGGAIQDWIQFGPSMVVDGGNYFESGRDCVSGYEGRLVLVDYKVHLSCDGK